MRILNMAKMRKFQKVKNLKIVFLRQKISGVQNINTWENESKEPIRDTVEANASGTTRCTKAGGFVTSELALAEKYRVKASYTQAAGSKILKKALEH